MDGGSAARVTATPARQAARRGATVSVLSDRTWLASVARPDAEARGIDVLERAGSGFYRRAGKRALDLSLSSGFLLLIGSWLLPLLALAIRLDSRGPAIFRQQRIGHRGQPFTCLKFRTMAHAPDAEFAQATREDPRITRVGRFLRRTNLDEIPQFINVLLGEMSIVGPRPHVPDLDDLFAHQVPGYVRRVTVRPGVTGLAQISGARGETRSVDEMAQRVHYDLRYIRSCSLRADLMIMIKTLRCVIFGDSKAY